MNTKIPPFEEIDEERKRLIGLGLAWNGRVQVSVDSDGVQFWTNTPFYDAAYSGSLTGLEAALREVIQVKGPSAKLKKDAERLGYELVKKEVAK